jgi:adenine-specific DNA-methyltransferase
MSNHTEPAAQRGANRGARAPHPPAGLRAALAHNAAVRPNSELLATLRKHFPQFFTGGATVAASDMECGDLSPLSARRLVAAAAEAPENHPRSAQPATGGVASPAVKSGENSPHSKKAGPLTLPDGAAVAASDMECGDLSPLSARRLVAAAAPENHPRSAQPATGGAASPAVKSGENSPHSKKAGPLALPDGAVFNLEKFLAELRTSDIAEARDGYKLGFVGKDYARLQSGRVSETVLAPDCAHNALPENASSGNVFITGDNLEALRHLVNAYEGKIKLIYIDPPYNTGKEFVYSDKFEFDDEKLRAALGYTDAEIERLKSIQGKSSHSAWLTFMYPRLKLAQKLLRDDGVIFVSIDDNEQANLKLLMDEVFGEGNFVNTLIWIKANKPLNISDTGFSRNTESIIFYKKNEDPPIVFLPLTDEHAGTYKNPDSDNRGEWTRVPLFLRTNSNKPKELIMPWDKSLREEKWFCSQETLDELWKDRRIIVTEKQVYKKIFLKDSDGRRPLNILESESVGFSRNGTEDVISLGLTFDFPKPVKLIKFLASRIPDKEGIILDFFAGSATTAHAVMQLNAEDGGNRKYIMVQWAEPVGAGGADVTQVSKPASSDANEPPNSRFGNLRYVTIDEISRERIKRAGKKILAEYTSKETGGAGELPLGDGAEKPRWDKDIGFKHYRLVTPDIKTLEKIETFDANPDPSAPMLIADDMVTPFARPETKTSGLDTLLATWLIDDGFPFDTPVTPLKFAGYKAHLVQSKLYLISQDWGAAQTKDLLNRIGTNELHIQHLVVYAYSFKMESLRELEINIKNTLDADHQVYVERRY